MPFQTPRELFRFLHQKIFSFDFFIKLNDKFKQIGTVEQKTISEIIDIELNGNCPTVLSIDIEGKDYDAIKGMNFKEHSPKFI